MESIYWLVFTVAQEQAIFASVAQLAEQLICNQQVMGSSPLAGSVFGVLRSVCGSVMVKTVGDEGSFPSGQRGQTVNLMAMPS